MTRTINGKDVRFYSDHPGRVPMKAHDSVTICSRRIPCPAGESMDTWFAFWFKCYEAERAPA